jgi:mannose-6-phosphate isomerase-like protein (cupin superfamily)
VNITSRQNAEHYAWGEVCEGWRLLAGPDLSVIQERIPPGRGEVSHRHARARQLFFVLEGELQMESEGAIGRLRKGDSVEIPPGRVHRVSNPADEDALFLVVSAPTTTGDRINVDQG